MAISSESQNLSRLLGLYRAEWLNNQLYELFTTPTYFGELTTPRPCILLGGRGTGKTTVLKGLSYQGQYALKEKSLTAFDDVPFVGLYYRVNTNRVTAFQGAEVASERWTAYFSHYVNLVFCQLLLDFVEWREEKGGIETVCLRAGALSKITRSLGVAEVSTLSDLANAIDLSLVEFEATVNTIGDQKLSRLSMQAVPIDLLAAELLKTPALRGKQFFFLIDEYENLLDYQQRVLNTIIKHSSEPYTFKVGIKELGWRSRSTISEGERLTHPADYARIHIADVLKGSKFREFATQVVEARVHLAYSQLAQVTIGALFPDLSEMDEAARQLDSGFRDETLRELRGALSKEEFKQIRELRPGELYFLEYWANEEGHDSLAECARDWIKNEQKWANRLNNHFYASLFQIKQGKTGIRKYYAGWDTMLTLSNGNIRYLLELTHTAFLRQLDRKVEPPTPIDPEIQTQAAQEVGGKNLAELDGLSVQGARLTKLVLSLGRIFQILASDAGGHTPELNQFTLRTTPNAPEIEDKVENLLNQAVMHQALIRFKGNKPEDERATRDYDYALHPIFAPFFVFSHRRKRKLPLEDSELLGLVDNHRDTIKRILAKANREDAERLPDQLELFGAFYDGN